MTGRLTAVVALLSLSVSAASAAPDYHQLVLESIYPSGGQRGTSVTVQLTGTKGSLKGADSVLIDGPPGISVSDFQVDSKGTAQATFTIAPDAVPGRRMVRVKGGVTGLTSFRWFFVSGLPEYVEGKSNNTPTEAEPITLPVVVNGKVNPLLDQDCFRFQAKAGQTPVLAVMSHWLDAMIPSTSRDGMGFADLSLEVLDSSGRIVAQAGDTLGNDPLIHFQVPADGEYIARVSGMGYKGFPQAVYRLTIGEVPYPTAVFPAGGQRGDSVEVEFSGPNVPAGTRLPVLVEDDPFGVQYVSLPDSIAGAAAGVHELPFIRDHLPRQSSQSDSGSRETAPAVKLGTTIDGRFDKPGTECWYRLKLEKSQTVTLAILAQRHLRSPVDTRLDLFDAAETLVASNDDGALFASECSHDFVPFDSRLEFTAKSAGEYFLRVSEQTGTTGPRAVFRLSVFETQPDFRIYQWPDAVPLWGPGATTAFVVETHRLGGLENEITLSVEGLPTGWKGSTNVSLNTDYRIPQRAFGQKTFLTITAPDDAEPGTVVTFRVEGRCQTGDRELIRIAKPLTIHMFQEPNHFRASPVARAVVASSQLPRFLTEARELNGKPGEQLLIPVTVTDQEHKIPGKLMFSINRGRAHFQCALGPQVSVSQSDGKFLVPLTIPANLPPGRYGITVADAWSSETRKGLPGPCTPLIQLIVEKP